MFFAAPPRLYHLSSSRDWWKVFGEIAIVGKKLKVALFIKVKELLWLRKGQKYILIDLPTKETWKPIFLAQYLKMLVHQSENMLKKNEKLDKVNCAKLWGVLWTGDTSCYMIHLWCADDALMMRWWYADDALLMRWWCTIDALMMHW